MKVKIILTVFVGWAAIISAQTPTYYVHNPATMGVNNAFMNNLVTKRFLFIYSKAELNAAGVAGPTPFNTIWFRMNNAGTATLNNCIITIGHTTFSPTSPNMNFMSNFNVGAPVTALSVNPLNYTFVAGTWGTPAHNWSPVTLSTSFTYDDVNNLAVMIEFSNQMGTIPGFYASNTGTTVYTGVVGGANATGTYNRPAFGISDVLPFDTPILSYHKQGSTLLFSLSKIEKSIESKILAYSHDQGEKWFFKPLDLNQDQWIVQSPKINTLYRVLFSDKNGSKFASNIVEVIADTEQPQSIFVYPTINKGRFSISYWESIHQVQLLDLSGKLILTIPLDSKNSTQDIEVNLPPGMYIIYEPSWGSSVKVTIQVDNN
ncbi:MAG: hypothetical protein RML38_07520 [Bacteroidia bacterium]|nr:hypothetical protein [Bacteroidia bacterium]